MGHSLLPMLQSLTSLCALRDSEYHFLSDLKQLQVLELGDCLNWTSQVNTIDDMHLTHCLRPRCTSFVSELCMQHTFSQAAL